MRANSYQDLWKMKLKIYNYFSSSPKRIAKYAEFQTFCGIKIQKILHPAQTPWLSVQSVVSRILEEYRAL